MSEAMWEVDKMLDVYIYDYLLKRKLHASARSFLDEGKVFMDSVAIDAPGGFLLEWWSVFWDIFITRINPQHSEAAASYIKLKKAGDWQLQQQHYLQSVQQNPTTVNRPVMNNSFDIQNPTNANKMAAKMYGENLTLPNQRNALITNGLPKRLDPLSSRILQQPELFIQLRHTSNQFQLQHPFAVQTPRNLGVPSANVACKRPGVPLSQHMNIGKKKQLCFVDVSGVDPLAPVCPVLPHVNADMLTKEQFMQHPVSSQHSLNSNHLIQQQDKLNSSGITNADSYMSNNFQANDQADVDCLVDDGPYDVESFLSPDGAVERDKVGLLSDANEGPALKEIRRIPGSKNKVECCRFSSDGKLLASGGHNKVTVWCTESLAVKSTLSEHSQMITDVCFSSRALKIATSSSDRTVKIWDVDNGGPSLRTFTGHSTGVTSLDFHPSKDDLICSSDVNSEIRYWSIKNSSCVGIFKGGAKKLRFQPNNGRIIAAAVGNAVSIIDVETQVCRLKLQGHKNHIHSVCWDPSGEYLASVSEDLAKVWKVGSGGKGDCINELNCNGKIFHTCVFHPTNTSLLIIGSHESLEIWDITENKTRTLHAHGKLVSALAASHVTGLVASASHDSCIKLWQ
ncbi:transcriptional corepressor LEUNIG-like isoform X2 [Momordica charantia]|uniref:Transcriptional corepressor LEUNIG-like isoform X2 n=1 Tax=Momordica charantia TaxID=3673 RepID=A0A6J1CUW6_MOMCH|nr:transcriptional corepressor LEUNIG-like isoform X2 [Momordica charantia]